MATVDADNIMVIAGILLSALAFVEIYSIWKKTRRTERSDDGSHAVEGAGKQNRDPSVSDG